MGIILQDEVKYQVGSQVITVTGMDEAVFSVVAPICGAMDLTIKKRIVELSKDEALSEAFRKGQTGEELSPEEKIALANFSVESTAYDFDIEQCKQLFDSFKICIKSVKNEDNSEVSLEQYLEEVSHSPKYLKSFSNLIYTEYKEAIDLPEIKKSNTSSF